MPDVVTPQVLEVEYPTAADFGREFRANLASGGVFVVSEQSFEPREIVSVRLRLVWCQEVIDLEGEVVHIVPPEMAGVGGKPGVAVQFLVPPNEVRDRLAPWCTEGVPAAPAKASAGEERRALRKAVRVPARIEFGGESIAGRTRNLSRTGVLIELSEGSVPVGKKIRITLNNPSRNKDLKVGGTVVRHVKDGGRVSGVAVHLEPEPKRRAAVERFIEALQSAEHTRQLGAISGPIAELGPQSIVQMFATTVRSGTILLRRGEEEGLICFDGGLLRAVRTGTVTGMKALVRMLSWREGTFEFHTEVEQVSTGDAPFPLEAAVFDAVRQIDEGQQIDPEAFPLQARLVALHTGEGTFTGALSKVEEALLDLANAGFTVQRALEVIPEPDVDIFRALRALIDGEMLELR